jgi:hypothetical protein
MPDLVEGVELRDFKPVSRQDIVQRGVRGDSPAHLLKHDLGRPAFLLDQQVTKDVQPVRPSEMTQVHSIEYPDLIDDSGLPSHGSTSASMPAGRSVAVICPCISSTALVAVIAPFLHAAMTAWA